MKVLIKNDTYGIPKWIEAKTIKHLKKANIYMLEITDPLHVAVGQIAFRKPEHIKVRAAQ